MKSIATSILMTGVLLLAGCASEPWVKPYERANLADPIMSFNRDPISARYIHHRRSAASSRSRTVRSVS